MQRAMLLTRFQSSASASGRAEVAKRVRGACGLKALRILREPFRDSHRTDARDSSSDIIPFPNLLYLQIRIRTVELAIIEPLGDNAATGEKIAHFRFR